MLDATEELGIYLLHNGNAGRIIRQRDRSEGYAAIHYGRLDKYVAWRQLREGIAEAIGVDVRIAPLTTEDLVSGATTAKEFCVKLDNPIPDVQAKTVRFDVLAKTNVPGLKFGRAEILIDYPTGNLGEWIVDQAKVESEKGEVTDAPTYSIDVVDQTKQQINLVVESDCEDGGPHYVLDTVYERLATLTVEVNEWADLGTMNVSDFAVAGAAEYVLPQTLSGNDAPGCEPFDELCGDGSFPFMTCMITQLNYTNRGAGYLDEVRIEGNNFVGNSSFLQELSVPSADDGGATKFSYGPLDNATILSWSDTEIRFRIESYQGLNQNEIGPSDPMGSGQICVNPDLNSNDPNTLVCFAKLDVDYSVGSGFDENAGYRKTGGVAFQSNESDLGELEVYLDETIDQNAILNAQGITIAFMEDLVSEVLCQYEQASRLRIEYKGTGLQSQMDRADVFIGFRALSAGLLGETEIAYNNLCVDVGDQQFYGRRRASTEAPVLTLFMAENPGDNWYLGPEGAIPSGRADLQSTLLHEFGHALGLGHAQIDDDPNSLAGEPIMYYRNFDQTRRSLDSKTATGGERLVSLSELATTSTRCFDGFLLDRTLACVSPISEPNSELPCRRIYFISDDVFHVECDLPVVAIEVRDILGRKLRTTRISSENYRIEELRAQIYFISLRLSDGQAATYKMVRP